jgi:hypothetical protein
MKYVGSELDLFQHATVWKRYFSGILAPYIEGDILEVGGGLGGTMRFLIKPGLKPYTI